MADDDFRKFRTDFGQLMEYIKYSTDDEKLDQIVQTKDSYRHLDVDLANLINDLTGKKLTFEVKEGEVDGCKAHEEKKRKAAENAAEEAWEQANQRSREVEAERDEYKSELNEYKSELNEYKSELDKALRTIKMYEAR